MGTVESLSRFLPELVLSGAVLAVILIDVALRSGSVVPGLVALLGSLAALVLTTGFPPAGIPGLVGDAAPSWLFGRMLVLDGFSLFFKVLLGLARGPRAP
jgi:NADH:ubiquinone oxidoreductase subunit 2 (subunit N)